MDVNLRIRCPICRAINWSRDGFTMAVDINGELHPIRISANDPNLPADASWQCERCGYRPAYPGDLAHALDRMETEFDEARLRQRTR